MNTNNTSHNEILAGDQPKFLSCLSASLVLLGVIVLFAWLNQYSSVIHVLPGLPAMSVATALLFCFSGLSLCSLSAKARNYHFFRLCVATGILVFAVFSFVIVYTVQNAITRADFIMISPGTAFGFSLTAVSLIFLELKKYVAVQNVAIILMMFTIFILLSYINHTHHFYRYSQTLGIALHTTAGLFIISCVLILQTSKQGMIRHLYYDSEGIFLGKRFFPVIIIVPLVIGSFCHILHEKNLIGEVTEHTLLATLPTFQLVFLLLYLGRSADDLDIKFKRIADITPLMMWVTAKDGKMLYFNKPWLTFSGRSLTSEMQIECTNNIHTEDYSKALQIYKNAYINEQPFTLEYRLLHYSGEYHWVMEKANPYHDANGMFKGFVGICIDINEQKNAAAQWQLTEIIVDNAEQGILVTDKENLIIKVNSAFTRITGYSEHEVLGENPNILRSSHHDKHFYQQMWTAINKDKYWQGEIWCRHKEGEIYLELLTINAITDDHNRPMNYIGFISDITQKKNQEDRIFYLAHHDRLTSLPNRLLLQERLERAISHAKRHDESLAIISLDLDQFNTVNVQYGHLIGDLLLVEVANRLTECTREEDTVSHQVGDKFVILLPRVNGENSAYITAKNILNHLSHPYHLGKQIIDTSISIGITVYPSGGMTPEELIQNADMAMCQAKKAENNSIVIFNKDHN